MNILERGDDPFKSKQLDPGKKLSFKSLLSIQTDDFKFQKIFAISFKKNYTITTGKCATFYFVGLEDSRMSDLQSTIEKCDCDNIWNTTVEKDNSLEFSHNYDCLIICMGHVISKELAELACKAYRTNKLVAFVQLEDGSRKKPKFSAKDGAYVEAIDHNTEKICNLPYFYIDLVLLRNMLEYGIERSWHDKQILGECYDEQLFVDFLSNVIKYSSYREKSNIDEKHKVLSLSKSSTVIKNYKLLDSLKCACEEKDEQKFFQLINEDDEFSSLKDQSLNTILHMAAKNFDNSSIIESILEKSSTLLRARNVENKTALMLSVEENNFRATQILLKKYADFIKELEVDETMKLSDAAKKHPEIQFLQKFYENETALMVFIEAENFDLAETLFNTYNKSQISLKENEKQMMLEAAIKHPDVKFLQNFYHAQKISTEDYEEVLTKEESKYDTASHNAVNNFAFNAENLSIAFIVSWPRSWKILENNVLESDLISLEEFDCWFIFITENINNSEIKVACKAKEINKPVAFLQKNSCDRLLSESGESYFLTKSGKHHIVTLKNECMEICEVPLFKYESTISNGAMLDEEDFSEFLKKTISFIIDERVLKEHDNLILSIENENLEQVLSYLNSLHWQKLFCRHSSDIQSPVRLMLIHMPEIADKLFEKCVQEGEKEYLVELIDDYPPNSYDLQTLKQNFYSFLSSIGSKIRNPFARTASAQKTKSQVKNE